MSVDILKMLISSACEGGEINEGDKVLLRKKASGLGISNDELEKMISAELKGEVYVPSTKTTTPPTSEQLPNAHLKVTSEPKNSTPPPPPPPVTGVKKETKLKVENPVMPGILADEVKKEVVSNKKTPPPPPPVQKPVVETPKEVVTPVIKPIVAEKKVVTPPVKKVEPKKVVATAPTTEKSKSKMMPIIIGGVVVLLLIVGFIFKDSILGSGNEEVNNNKTDETENVVDNDKNKEDLYKKFMEEGKTAFANQEFLKAKTAFENALKNKEGDADATTWVNKLSSILSLLNEANELFKNKNMIRASLRYDSLQTISPDIKAVGENLKTSKDIVKNAKKLKLEKGEGKFGFADKDGNLVVDFVFTEAEDFFGKMAPVKNSVGKWGLIGHDYHKTSKFIVEPKFDDIKQQQSGYICEINGDHLKYVFFYKGNKLIERKF